MKTKNNKRYRTFANKLHREIFLTVLAAALLPCFVVTVALYYLIFNVMSGQLGIPEAIAYNIIPAARKVSLYLILAAPASVFIILLVAYRITYRIIGPFDRIVKELDEVAKGKKENHIVIRKKDKFQPLVDGINKLIDKCRPK
jgi:sensor histidine kinase YesM